jgi:hypothetical protein
MPELSEMPKASTSPLPVTMLRQTTELPAEHLVNAFEGAPTCAGYLQVLSKMGVLVGDFYLLLGQSRPARPLPAGVPQGVAKQCYKNAGVLALESAGAAYTYCEGYALRKGLIPVHHAWCLDAQGHVVDPTWPFEEGNEYLGVAFEYQTLVRYCLDHGVWGMLSEALSPFVVRNHPQSYLHSRWRVTQERQDLFWDRLQAARSKDAPPVSTNS